MKIYSDRITREDVFRTLHEALPGLAHADEFREFTPRKNYARGFTIYLEALRDTGRARNGRPGKALTWDEYGVWFAKLYEIDPYAEIAFYKNEQEFRNVTAYMVSRVRPPGEGPWLTPEEITRGAYRWLVG